MQDPMALALQQLGAEAQALRDAVKAEFDSLTRGQQLHQLASFLEARRAGTEKLHHFVSVMTPERARSLVAVAN
jgi:hypothetical protein